MATNLTADFVGILLPPVKVHADAINDWQHCGAKSPTKSELHAKYGNTFFGKKYEYKHRLSRKTAS